jgi:hypothetical protein
VATELVHEGEHVDLGDVDESGEDPVAIAAIEAVAEVAEAALGSVVEMHAQEEETERLEVIEEGETERTEVLAEAVSNFAEEESEGEHEVDEEPEEVEEPEGAPEEVASGEPIAVAPPPREEAAQGGKVPVKSESAFSRRHRH